MKAQSFHIVSLVCSQIVYNSQIEYENREFVRENMNDYSSNRVIFIVNQLGDQLLAAPNTLNSIEEDTDPERVPQDNLMPINNFQIKDQLSIQEGKMMQKNSENLHVSKQSYHKKRSSQYTVLEEESRKTKRSFKNQMNPALHKLIHNQEEDKQIDKMRKVWMKRQEEEDAIRRKKIQNSNKKFNQNDVVNYDYDGNLIKIKPEPRKNLVQKIIKGNPENQEIKKQKCQNQEIFKEKERLKTFNVEVKAIAEEKNKYGIKKSIPTLKNRISTHEAKVSDQPNIQFSMIKDPLTNLDLKQGVKAVFNKNVRQGCRKQEISIKDLRKTLTDRHLSKQQYNQLKKQDVKVLSDKKKEEQIQERMATKLQGKLNEKRAIKSAMKRSITDAGQKISVQDINLKKALLEKMTVEEQSRAQKISDPTKMNNKQGLNKLDEFNLDYSRRRPSTTIQDERKNKNNTVLPKVRNKNSLHLPKRIRQSHQSRQGMNLKFQQTLRT